MMPKSQRIRDPLHNLIEFGSNPFDQTLWNVIQTEPFQRLRRIKQLGFSELTYPGATHTRFSHSLGVLHVARNLMRVIEQRFGKDDYDPIKANVALAAALVHDVGHGPFSHAFEEVGRRMNLSMAHHETVSNKLIRNGPIAEALNQSTSGFANDVANLVGSAAPADIYAAVVSSQFDADRLDYMQRDRLMAGTMHGVVDFNWLLSNLEVGEVPYGSDNENIGTAQTFVLGPKAHYAVDAYVLGLFQLYPTVYYHKATRGAEKLFTELLCRIFTLTQESCITKTGLPSKHPLIQFAKHPEKIENVLALDDAVVWGALGMMSSATDTMIAEFSNRLRTRKLYKAIDIREKLTEELAQEVAGWSQKDTAQRYVIVDKASAIIEQAIGDLQNRYLSKILVDRGDRHPYRRYQDSKGPLNQIMIKTASGTLTDVVNVSDLIRSIRPFEFFRVYVPPDNKEVIQDVSKIIKQGVSHARNSD